MKEQSISIQKTFDSFIVSRSNVEAYSACVDLVNDPKGKLVAIYGANSYGKSHLLCATKNALVEGHSDLSIRFTNYDDVISQYITSLHNREHKAFVEELLETDVLIMDNMQFIAGKEATQDEVADWINKLIEAGKLVVIAFDRPIKYFSPLLKGVEERHPDSCTVAEVKRPDRFLRKKYIEFLLTEYPVTLPRFLKGYIIISRKIPFSALTGFIHKCSLLEKQKGQALSLREIRKCLYGYMHKEV